MEKSVMTLEEVAKYLSFSAKHVQRLTATGEIPHSRIGGHIRFLKSRIDEWIREHELKPSVFCAGCSRVFTEPILPPTKRKEDIKSPEYIRIKQFMDGGKYFCPACFAKSKPCSVCGEHFLPNSQNPGEGICDHCDALEAARKK